MNCTLTSASQKIWKNAEKFSTDDQYLAPLDKYAQTLEIIA